MTNKNTYIKPYTAEITPMGNTKLKCPGVGRDKDCITALQFYFSRPVTDDEMRYLHEVIQRAVLIERPKSMLNVVRIKGR